LKAIIYKKYGGPEVLELTEVEKPVPGNNEVLVKVHALSINDWDWGLLQGDFVNRMMYGLFKPKRQILCSDIAGTVEGVGENVKQFRVGDAVYGDLSGRWGGLAAYACAPENMLSQMPPGMSFETAAALPQAGMLAVQGLIDKGEIKQGQKILINGAGGGVGTLGLQIAKTFGAEVTGVDSAGKLEMMRSLGFDHVIDYAKEDFTKNRQQYDLVLDVKTNRPVFDYTRALVPGGIYVTVGGSMPRLLQAVVIAGWISRAKNKHVRIVMLKPNKDLAYINELWESGKLQPVIDGPYEFNDVKKAFALFGSGRHRGKVVIRVVPKV
jgi:NADPH:quinone reductase-like Zn-dependent oxidoreductase